MTPTWPAEPIRVVHLVTCLEMGGLERVVSALARLIDRTRVVQHVICLESGGALTAELDSAGVTWEIMRASTLRKARRVIALARRLRAFRGDVLHTHNPGPHVHGAVARAFARVPVLLHTKHGRNYPEDRRAVLLNRVASVLSSRIVAVSDDAWHVALHVEHVPSSKLITIVNGVDLDAYPSRPLTCAAAWSAVHVGRLDAVKDQATLLRAARLVANQRPDFRLEIVGDGPARPVLEELARSLNLTQHVTFAGFRTDVADRLAAARLFVLSSVSEGTPLTLIEAMATGRAAVATAVGGNAEVIDNGITGLLVPPRQPKALAAAMSAILSDDRQLERMGNAARVRAQKHYGAAVMASRYTALYESLVRKGMARVDGSVRIGRTEHLEERA